MRCITGSEIQDTYKKLKDVPDNYVIYENYHPNESETIYDEN